MKITGKNLELLVYGLECGVAEVHNQIATCPNVFEHAEEIEELEADKAKLTKLLERARKELAKQA